MKTAGHTMGTASMTLEESMCFMASLGHQGIEVRLPKDSPLHPASGGGVDLESLKAASASLPIAFACLCPYEREYLTREESQATVEKLKQVAELAAELSCPYIRLLSGVSNPKDPAIHYEENWQRTVDGIQAVARHAARIGVGLCIETHSGTLAMSARMACRLIDDINMNNVGLLLDVVWDHLANVGGPVESIKRYARYLRHVHIKDCRVISRLPPRTEPVLYGHGVMDISGILTALDQVGFEGYVCDEYEKYWYPDLLPDPESGMKHNIETLLRMLRSIGSLPDYCRR